MKKLTELYDVILQQEIYVNLQKVQALYRLHTGYTKIHFNNIHFTVKQPIEVLIPIIEGREKSVDVPPLEVNKPDQNQP